MKFLTLVFGNLLLANSPDLVGIVIPENQKLKLVALNDAYVSTDCVTRGKCEALSALAEPRHKKILASNGVDYEYCKNQNGSVLMLSTANGDVGVCSFIDGSKISTWDLFKPSIQK